MTERPISTPSDSLPEGWTQEDVDYIAQSIARVIPLVTETIKRLEKAKKINTETLEKEITI